MGRERSPVAEVTNDSPLLLACKGWPDGIARAWLLDAGEGNAWVVDDDKSSGSGGGGGGKGYTIENGGLACTAGFGGPGLMDIAGMGDAAGEEGSPKALEKQPEPRVSTL